MENPKIFNILILLMHLSMVCPRMGVGGGGGVGGQPPGNLTFLR